MDWLAIVFLIVILIFTFIPAVDSKESTQVSSSFSEK